ncbi:MAG: hypothetical protein U0903_08230 [Planctomycetales bacterium]
MNETAPQDDIPPSLPAETPTKKVSTVRVIGEIFLGTMLLSGFCYLLPSRVKLFFLYPILVGAAVGGLNAWRSSQARFPAGWMIPLILGLLVWGGQLGLQYRDYVQRWRQSFARDPAAEWDKEWRQKASDPANASDPAVKPYREYLQSVNHKTRTLELGGFLEFRSRPLGLTRSPWPWIIGAAEWIFCGIASAVATQVFRSWFPILGQISRAIVDALVSEFSEKSSPEVSHAPESP